MRVGMPLSIATWAVFAVGSMPSTGHARLLEVLQQVAVVGGDLDHLARRVQAEQLDHLLGVAAAVLQPRRRVRGEVRVVLAKEGLRASRTARAARGSTARRPSRRAGRTAPSRWPARAGRCRWPPATCRGRRRRARAGRRRSDSARAPASRPRAPRRAAGVPQRLQLVAVAQRVHRLPEAVVVVGGQLAARGDVAQRLLLPLRVVARDRLADGGLADEEAAVDPRPVAARLLGEARARRRPRSRAIRSGRAAGRP